MNLSTQDIHFEMRGNIAVIRLTRPTKRNALSDSLVASIRKFSRTCLKTQALR